MGKKWYFGANFSKYEEYLEDLCHWFSNTSEDFFNHTILSPKGQGKESVIYFLDP